VGTPIEFKRLARVELSSVAEIDRTERIDLIYEQRGTELEERRGNWSSAAWDPHGHGEHSVAAQRHALEHYLDAGGIALGAFSKGRLVGIGVVVPHLRPRSRSSRSSTSARRSAQRASAVVCPTSWT
jgi:predicted GNAT superfamily acetyltransferase